MLMTTVIQISWATKSLLTLLLMTLFGMWVDSRKKMIKMLRLPGPRPLPLVGNLLRIFRNGFNINRALSQIIREFNGFLCLWLCHVPIVIITAPEHLKTFYMSTRMIDRSSQYNYAKDFLGSSLFVTGGPLWKKLRKMMMVSFVLNTPMETLKKTFLHGANQLVNIIRPNVGGKEFKLELILTKVTANNIFRNALGDKLSDEDAPRFLEALDYLMKVVFWRNFSILYRYNFIFNLLPEGRKFWRDAKYVDDFVKDLILRKKAELEEMKKNGDPIPSIYIFNMLKNHGGESLDLLAGEVKTLIATGLDTTANSIGFSLTMLGLYPEIQEKVYQEDQEVQKMLAGREIELEDLNNCYPYLERVFKEVLRLFPVVNGLGRTVSTDTYFGKHLVPAGSSVTAIQVFTNHTSEYFEDPIKFNPDRFLPENIDKIPPYAFNPFSNGPRICLGMRYANLAMKITVATVVRNYKIKTSVKSLRDALRNVDSTFSLKDKRGHTISIEARC